MALIMSISFLNLGSVMSKRLVAALITWLVVVVAVAAALATATASNSADDQQMTATTPEMDAVLDLDAPTRRPSSRFLLEQAGEGMNRRNLLFFNLCGRGTAPNYDCKNRYPFYKNATCCNSYGSRLCFDVGGNYDYMCGSCGNRCSFGMHCCSGRCVNQSTNRKHCGGCGRICKNGVPCTLGMCSYGGGRDSD